MAQQRHLVMHSDGCTGEPSTVAGEPLVPCPAGALGSVPIGRAAGEADGQGRMCPTACCDEQEPKQKFGNSSGDGSKKATKASSAYCSLFCFSFFSFSTSLLQSTEIFPECSVETCAPANCRYLLKVGTQVTFILLFFKKCAIANILVCI